MFELFKKKEAKSITDSPTNSSPLIIPSGQEVTFKDPKTGQLVYQRALSLEHKKMIMDTFQLNAEQMNRFLRAALDFLMALERAQAELQNIKISEKEIFNTVQKVRDELKLGKMWEFLPTNPGVLERREAPPA